MPAKSRSVSPALATMDVDNEGGSSVKGAGIDDVIEMANTMANCANRVAACRVPPALLSE